MNRAHLTSSELHSLVDGKTSHGLDLSAPEASELNRHVEACPACRENLDAYLHADQRLSSELAKETPSAGFAEHPAVNEWAELALGQVADARASELLYHASGCQRCAEILRSAMGDEEETAPGPLLLVEKPRKGRVVPHLRTLLAIAAGLAFVVGGSLWFSQRQNDPDRLLARAYTAGRPFAFRLPDAGHAKVKKFEKAPLSIVDQPEELRRAITAIQQSPGNDPDAVALRRRAHAELLGLGADNALETLERARRLNRLDPEAELLLGCAYFLRAKTQSKNPLLDYSIALEHTKKWLELHNSDPIGLYNIALLYEEIGNREAALHAWRRYLEADPTSDYAGEARTHINDLEKGKQVRDRTLGARQADPRAFLDLHATGTPYNPELFLDVALGHWMMPGSGPENAKAAAILARALFTISGDTFLTELTRSPLPAAGLKLLSDATTANRSGRPQEGIELAAQAAMQLRPWPAAALRARTEAVYGLHRGVHTSECLREAERLAQDLKNTPYAWMRTQVLIEQSVCEAYQGKLMEAIGSATAAAQLAEARQLSSQELRARGMLANYLSITGNTIVPWRVIPSALSRYWSEAYPVNHVHQYFWDLSTAASRENLPRAAMTYAEWSVSAISQTNELLLQATGRERVSALAAAIGDTQESSQQLAEAQRLFSRVGNSKLKSDYQFDALLFRASQLPPDEAIELLANADRKTLPTESGRLRLLDILAADYGKKGRWKEAAAIAKEGIALNRQMREKMKTPLERLMAAARSVEVFALDAQIDLQQSGGVPSAFATWQELRSAKAAAAPLPWPTSATVETYLSFAELRSGIVLWVWDEQGLEVFPVSASTPEVLSHIDRLSALCSRRDSSEAEIDVEARWLRSALTQSAQRRLPANKTLILEAGGSLSQIPFGLLFPDHALVRTNSWDTYWQRAGREPVRPQARLLTVTKPIVAPELSAFYPPMPEAEEEAVDVARHFQHATRLEGAKATVLNVLASMAEAEVIHYSGHGSANGGAGALILSPTEGGNAYSGILGASQIAGSSMFQCALIVLSGCSTAAGEGGAAVHPESLVRAFLLAGAGRVVASFWNVDAASTRQFMNRFYRKMLPGLAPADALHRAQQEMRITAGSSHPYYWAAFQLFGYR